MHINIQIRRDVDNEFVCFRHAVLAAMAGKDVHEDVDEQSDQDMRSWMCMDCHQETVRA